MNYIRRTSLLLLSILWVGVMLAQRVTIEQADFKKIIEGGLPVGDVNGDGEVGIADIVSITNIMAGH